MDKMTITEAAYYIKAVDLDGFTLTPFGVNAAKDILCLRAGWTSSHSLMLSRIESGTVKVPLKLARLVNRTRLGDALEIARKFARKHIRNQKCNARRKRAMARAIERVAA